MLLLHIMLRDLLTQKCVHKKSLLILDTPEHVDSENIKFKIGHRCLPTNFFQNYFHVFQVVLERLLFKKNEIFQNNRKIPFLVNFCQF
jgi:hypothetical protein